MEKNKIKYIYETVVDKEIIEQITEEREENGEKIKVTKDIKKNKPIKIAILQPDRKKFKDADIFYAKTLSYYLKEGLLPYSLVSKRYMNDGGPLTEVEKKTITSLRDKYVELQMEYFKMEGTLTEEQNKKRNEIILEMTEINRTIRQIKDSYENIFENTAEAKAKNDIIEWWILNLSLINEDNTDYKLLYGDGDIESKTQILEKLETEENPFYNEVIKKLSYFIAFWYSSSNNITIEDFKSSEEYYNKNISTYLNKEKEEIKKTEKNLEIETELEQKEATKN